MANPRLTDVFGINLTQEQAAFAIPKIDEDIPLYVDPFLLWNSPLDEHKALHADLIKFLGLVREAMLRKDYAAAATLLSGISEPVEMGLGGAAASKRGNSLGRTLIEGIMTAFDTIPQLRDGQLRHTEELQMVVPRIAEDRVSDITVSVLKKYFLKFTAEQVNKHNLPYREKRLPKDIFDSDAGLWVPAPSMPLPFNPKTDEPILLAPLSLLRHLPWINYDGYYKSTYSKVVLPSKGQRTQTAKSIVLEFNARNYKQVERYVEQREARARDCTPDPLFSPYSLSTLKAKLQELRALPTGTAGGADREYENLIDALLPSLFYPTLELAESRVRTLSGAHIRDLIFYNDAKTAFWKDDVRGQYDGRQPVFELKNVKELIPDHVDQLYRYLGDEFGRFGILVSRNPAPPAVIRNTVELHSAKRFVILCLDDRDIELMVSMIESHRDATEVIKKKYADFARLLPR